MAKASAGFLMLLLAASGCAPGQEWKQEMALPHELCHACGYVEEREADACAYRLRRLAGRPEPSTYSCGRH
jgi:hypothetical protein